MADQKTYPIEFQVTDSEGLRLIREMRQEMLAMVATNEEHKKKFVKNLREANKETFNYRKHIEEANDAVDKSNKTQKEQNILLQEFGGELRSRLNEVKIFGVGMGDLGDRVKDALTGTNDLIKDLKRFKTSLNSTNIALSQGSKVAKGFVAASRLIKVALASLGIGLVLIALAGLVKLLSKSEKITNAVSDAMAGLGAAVKASANFLSHLGKSFIRLANLDFKGYAEESRKAQQAWNEEIVTGYTEAANFNKVLRETKEVMDTIDYVKGMNAVEFIELNQIINSEAATYAERIAAANKLRNKQNSLLDAAIIKQREVVALAKGKEEIKKQELALEKFEAQHLTNEIRAEQQINRIEKERKAEEQERLDNIKKANEERIKANQQLLEKIQKINEEAEKLQGYYEEAAEAIREVFTEEDDDLSPLERINKKEEETLELLKETYDKVKADLGNEISDLNKEYKKLLGEGATKEQLDSVTQAIRAANDGILELDTEFFKERLDINEAFEEDRRELLDKQVEQHLNALNAIEQGEKKSLENRQKELDKFSKEMEEDFTDLLDLTEIPETTFEKFQANIQKWIKKAFQVKDEDYAEFIGALSNVAGTVANTWKTFYDTRIEENKRLLDNLKEQKEEYQSLIDEEVEDAAAGYRNDVSNAKQRYNDILAAEKKARADSIKLQRQQIIAETAISQAAVAVNLYEAASTIIAKSSKFGPVLGIIAAATGIASMLATFKKAKSQIESLKLYTGGDLSTILSPATRDHGLVNSTQGRNDKYGHGHRIEDSNVELGGNEYVNNSQTSIRYKEFLDRLNDGKFNHINLNKLGRETLRNYPIRQPGSMGITTESMMDATKYSGRISKEELKEALKEVMPGLFENQTSKLTNAIRYKRGITYGPDGRKVKYDDFRIIETE